MDNRFWTYVDAVGFFCSRIRSYPHRFWPHDRGRKIVGIKFYGARRGIKESRVAGSPGATYGERVELVYFRQNDPGIRPCYGYYYIRVRFPKLCSRKGTVSRRSTIPVFCLFFLRISFSSTLPFVDTIHRPATQTRKPVDRPPHTRCDRKTTRIFTIPGLGRSDCRTSFLFFFFILVYTAP